MSLNLRASTLKFDHAYPAIIRSVRQSRLLDIWINKFCGSKKLPLLDAFAPVREYPAQTELMI